MGFIADKPVEGDDSAILIGTELSSDGIQVDGGMEQCKSVIFGSAVHCGQGSTPTHWRKKGDSIIVG